MYIIQINDSYIHRIDKFENSRVFKIVKNLRRELDLLRSLWLAPINRQVITICITVVSIQIKAAISIPITSPGMFLPLANGLVLLPRLVEPVVSNLSRRNTPLENNICNLKEKLYEYLR